MISLTIFWFKGGINKDISGKATENFFLHGQPEKIYLAGMPREMGKKKKTNNKIWNKKKRWN